MIFLGYPGIGKSTLAARANGFIDLKSENFSRADKKNGNYCKVAADLSAQGYEVFISTHLEVQDYFKNWQHGVCAIFPALELKDDWINKLSARYFETRLDKDFSALRHVAREYESDIRALTQNYSAKAIIINSLDYDLKRILNTWCIDKKEM